MIATDFHWMICEVRRSRRNCDSSCPLTTSGTVTASASGSLGQSLSEVIHKLTAHQDNERRKKIVHIVFAIVRQRIAGSPEPGLVFTTVKVLLYDQPYYFNLKTLLLNSYCCSEKS